VVLKNLKVFIFISIIGVLGILNVWINNIVYIKARKIDELKDERDIWYIKYMNSISDYYKRRWNYEIKDSLNNSVSDGLVSDSGNKAISNPSSKQ
jgi:IS4 transposase